MPFKNEAQRRACYAQAKRYLSQGKQPKWDCKAYETGAKHTHGGRWRKVYQGPRGGRYVIYDGKRVYLSKLK